MNEKIANSIRRINLHKSKIIKKLFTKSVVAGFLILLLLFLKKLDLRITNNFLNTTRNWTEYEFDFVNDGKRVFGRVQRTLENSIEVLNTFNPMTKEYYINPIEGEVVNQYDKGVNEGIDIRVNEDVVNEPIAVLDGVVTRIEEKVNTGYFITITSEDKEIIYGYFIDVNLSEGDPVLAGDTIGALGTNKDGFKYLRIEMYEDDSSVNPLEYINLR